MADREKVMRGLKTCASEDDFCGDCPYSDKNREVGITCIMDLCSDALALLKETAMNDINKMPVKCRDCAYWELATYPWCCGDCKDIMNPKNGEYIKRIDAKRALTALSADLDAETVQRCIEAMNNLKAADVAPPIRCAECRYYEKRCKSEDIGWCNRPGAGCGQPEKFWCAGAERRDI